MLRKVLDLKGRKMDLGENCIMMNFTTCIKRIVFLEFIHRLVSQEQTKLKIIIDER
jgi:hypothetical protein